MGEPLRVVEGRNRTKASDEQKIELRRINRKVLKLYPKKGRLETTGVYGGDAQGRR